MKLSTNSLSRKKIIIASGIVATTLLGIYLYISIDAWNTVSTETDQYSTETTDLRDAFFSTDSAATSVRREVVSTIAKKSALSCEPSSVSAWQVSIIQNFEDRLEECQKSIEERDQLVAKAESIAEYYRTIDAITASIDKLSIDTKNVKVESYASRLTTVQEARRDMESLQLTHDASASLQKVSVASITEIETAWKLLIKANKAEDSAAFTKATKKITAAYKGLTALSKEAKTGYEDITSKL